MPSRASLNLRANAVGLDQTLYPNDSKLEQKVLYLEKNATAFTGTIGTTTLTTDATDNSNGDNITIGLITYTYVTALTEAKATGTLTNSVSFSDGDMVNAGNTAYIMRTTLSTSASTQNEVLIGANVAASLTNLAATINGTGQGTTTNAATLVNPKVTATSTSTTLVVTHIKIGTGGNNSATTTTAANASWGAAFLSGGAEAVANQITITGTAANTLAATKKAINGTGTVGTDYSTGTVMNTQVVATTLTSTTLVINAFDNSVTNASVPTTVGTAAHLSFTSTVLGSGVRKSIVSLAADDAEESGDKNVG